jgi:hypothetical protein
MGGRESRRDSVREGGRDMGRERGGIVGYRGRGKEC